MNFGLEKQLDRIVETLALSALMANNPSKQIEKRLREIAFPLEVMEEISENEDLTSLFEDQVFESVEE